MKGHRVALVKCEQCDICVHADSLFGSLNLLGEKTDHCLSVSKSALLKNNWLILFC